MLYLNLFTEIGSRNTERNTQNGICFFSEMFMNAELNYFCYILLGARGGIVVKALRYKLAGRGFDS
jgi:hypothetical protein